MQTRLHIADRIDDNIPSCGMHPFTSAPATQPILFRQGGGAFREENLWIVLQCNVTQRGYTNFFSTTEFELRVPFPCCVVHRILSEASGLPQV